jgi:hypothetical protein
MFKYKNMVENTEAKNDASSIYKGYRPYPQKLNPGCAATAQKVYAAMYELLHMDGIRLP